MYCVQNTGWADFQTKGGKVEFLKEKICFLTGFQALGRDI